MALKAIKFISTLVIWIEDTYKLLMKGENIKEDFWWITTRVIRSIFEDSLYLECSISPKLTLIQILSSEVP